MDRACVSKNLGDADRVVRAALFIALLAAGPALTRQPYALVAIGVVGGLLLETAVSAHCPVYGLLRWSTLREGGTRL